MYEPKTELGKLLLVLVQHVGAMEQNVFATIKVDEAIQVADELAAEYLGDTETDSGDVTSNY